VTVQPQERPPLWRNTTFLKWTAQIAFLLALIGLAVIVVPQVQKNLSDRDLTFGWGFLQANLGFLIGEGIDTDPSTGARTILVGIVNTLRVTVSGVIAATILGTIIGIARLSHNWIVNRLSTFYIESIRNVPLLLQMYFWFAVAQTFKILDPFDADTLTAGTYWFAPTRKGIGLPWIQPWGGFYQWMVWVLIGAGVGIFLYKKRAAMKEATGAESYPLSFFSGSVMLFAVIGWFAHPIWGWLGDVFDAIGGVVADIPTLALQLVLAGLSLAAGAWWIKRFLDERRTPSGLAKLTDDDWFRMAFAGVLAVAFAWFFFSFTAFSSKAVEVSGSFFSDWLAPKFDSASNVIDLPISDIEAQVAAGASLERIARDAGVPVHKLVDGLTPGVADTLDRAMEAGEITPAQLGDELELVRSRADYPLRWSRPEVVVRGSNFLDLSRNGGIKITPSFFAVWIAVTLYTASFIAEVVRAGILAVSKGQTEAAGALGLSRAQSLRFIILPQAFRIIFPPLGNQYLNLFKNTSLGIAVAYPEIVSVGQTTSNQTGQTLPVIAVWMGFFLFGSLVLSSIVNFYNRRMKLVER
jgi:His/Glu/Gln/Arg/opine family amino acid ABC transporter permease subunit